MKEKTDSELRWEKLVGLARNDVAPPHDEASLFRVVRAESVTPVAGWSAEVSVLFASARILPGCLATAAAFALFASWEAWETWQALPWAQWIATPGGGL